MSIDGREEEKGRKGERRSKCVCVCVCERERGVCVRERDCVCDRDVKGSGKREEEIIIFLLFISTTNGPNSFYEHYIIKRESRELK